MKDKTMLFLEAIFRDKWFMPSSILLLSGGASMTPYITWYPGPAQQIRTT